MPFVKKSTLNCEYNDIRKKKITGRLYRRPNRQTRTVGNLEIQTTFQTDTLFSN